MIAATHERPRRGGATLATWLAGLALCVAPIAALRPQPRAVPPPLYVGGRVYFDYCASCHGADARGTRFAPDLLDRIARMQRADFERVLDDGYPGVENGPPPWGGIDDVERYAAELWAYLDARANGTVPAGELIPER